MNQAWIVEASIDLGCVLPLLIERTGALDPYAVVTTQHGIPKRVRFAPSAAPLSATVVAAAVVTFQANAGT